MKMKNALFLNILMQIQQMKSREKQIDSRNINIPGKDENERIKILLNMMKRGLCEGNPLPDEAGEVGIIYNINLMSDGVSYIDESIK
jgi:hypothetical protein